MASYDVHITRTPGVQGGEPVIRGTRTPVRTVAVLALQVYPDNPEQVRATLPHLSAEEIDAALHYYADHRREIDDLIRRHAEAIETLRAAP